MNQTIIAAMKWIINLYQILTMQSAFILIDSMRNCHWIKMLFRRSYPYIKHNYTTQNIWHLNVKEVCSSHVILLVDKQFMYYGDVLGLLWRNTNYTQIYVDVHMCIYTLYTSISVLLLFFLRLINVLWSMHSKN